MKDPILQNGTDARLEAKGYRAERELVETVAELGDRASQMKDKAEELVATTKSMSKPAMVGAAVVSAALVGGMVWAVARRPPSTLERLFAPRRRRSTVLPVLGRAATSLALSAAATAARTILLAKLERALEQALEPSPEGSS